MNKVLVITSSISPKISISNHAIDIFIDNYKKNNPKDEINILDLNKNKKVLVPLNSNDFNEFWNDESDKLIDQLKSANKIVIGAGMVNFSIPTTLKAYFDNVLQAGKTFKYKYDGDGESIGLLDPKVKVQLFLAQGAPIGWYPFALFDKYLESILEFMGLKQINTVIYDGTKTKAKINLSIDEIINKEEIIKLSNNF